MSENSSRKQLQRIFIILSSVALVGVSIFPLLDQFGQPQPNPNVSNSPNTETGTANSAENEQFKQMEKGYEAVLQREPDNRIALQGLVEARAQQNNFEGAKAPMEKLLSLDPENPVYLQTLAQINLKLNDIDGALKPLEKLAKIYPDRKEIATVVDTLKKAQRGELPQQQASPVPQNPQPSPSSLPADPLATPDLSIPVPQTPADPLATPDLSIPVPSPQN